MWFFLWFLCLVFLEVHLCDTFVHFHVHFLELFQTFLRYFLVFIFWDRMQNVHLFLLNLSLEVLLPLQLNSDKSFVLYLDFIFILFIFFEFRRFLNMHTFRDFASGLNFWDFWLLLLLRFNLFDVSGRLYETLHILWYLLDLYVWVDNFF